MVRRGDPSNVDPYLPFTNDSYRAVNSSQSAQKNPAQAAGLPNETFL